MFKKMNDLYLIGEIGINHNGDLNITKKLIDAVNSCGWHCAKFQKRNPDVCVPDHQKNTPKKTPWGDMTYIEYKRKIEFEKNEYDLIDGYCKEKPVDWTVSVWDIDSLNFILQYDVPWIKIPSALLTDHDLIKEVARSGKPIILSTGMSYIDEIDYAVETVTSYTDDFALLHCNSEYPTPNKDINLNVIKFLKERYKCTIGYSGHEDNLMPSIIAYLMGANIIERHITLDHNMWGTDQKSSLEIVAMDMLKKRLKDIPDMLGDGIKKITSGEIEKRQVLRR